MSTSPYKLQLTKGFFVDLSQIARMLAYAVEHQGDGRIPPGAYEESLETLHRLLRRIARTDRLIDFIVSRLYGLTGEEVAIVEGYD